MKASTPLLVIALFAAGVSAGCTFPSKGTVYDRSAAGRSMVVETGDVVGVRDVTVSGRQTVVGTAGGGLVGSAAASGVGGGVGTSIARAVGAVGGAIAGEAIEEGVTRKDAQEITIKLSNGDTIAVVQSIEQVGRFEVGERVQVLQGRANATVRRL